MIAKPHKNGESLRTTIRLRHSDGYFIWAHFSARFTYDDTMRPVAISGSLTDVTTLIAIESALQDAHKKIDQTRQLNTSFLARMSHEIRTPLNAITGYVQLLERQLKDDNAKGHIKVIKESVGQLIDVMSEIIDAGRLEAGEMKLKVDNVNLETLMAYFDKAFLEEAKIRGLDFVVVYDNKMDMNVLIDEQRLSQIIFNLVNNAIKYTEKGVVLLRLETSKYSFNRVELKFFIEDTGVGITDQSIIDYINNEQSEDSINMITANGLGLSIVYNLTKMMKGAIHVTSTKETGTIFELTFKVTLASNKSDESSDYNSNIFFLKIELIEVNVFLLQRITK